MIQKIILSLTKRIIIEEESSNIFEERSILCPTLPIPSLTRVGDGVLLPPLAWLSSIANASIQQDFQE